MGRWVWVGGFGWIGWGGLEKVGRMGSGGRGELRPGAVGQGGWVGVWRSGPGDACIARAGVQRKGARRVVHCGFPRAPFLLRPTVKGYFPAGGQNGASLRRVCSPASFGEFRRVSPSFGKPGSSRELARFGQFRQVGGEGYRLENSPASWGLSELFFDTSPKEAVSHHSSRVACVGTCRPAEAASRPRRRVS